ncbi:PilW family protein [Vibrio sp. TRT 21S02]|uniref:PilW family protein n=1 Tax=Vibrio sp. TRT 21S02 TaxID=3418507 RepID=UPI003CF592D7
MKRNGFTLIEMILTIIVGGILVLGIAGFVEFGAQGYADTVERQRLQTQARFVLEKMTREIRHALPNVFTSSQNGTQSCFSFYPIDYSGFYSVSGADLQFIVGQDGASQSVLAPRTLIINPTSSLSQADNVISLSSVTQSGAVFSIANVASSIVGDSVGSRHYIFSASNQVTYCVDPSEGFIRRNNTVVADSVTKGSFDYSGANIQRGGLVHISLQFSRGDEQTHFEQDVQVLNVP